MERGPLPPHERTWRHPSELAAEERAELRAEEAAPSMRVFALTTGTIGLIAVAVLVLTVSPRRQESPIAISATTTPVAVTGEPQVRALAAGTATTEPSTRIVESIASDSLATPIGDGRFALITRQSLSGPSHQVAVRLASGRVVAAEIVSDIDADVVLVALAEPVRGHKVAHTRPADGDLVTVMLSPPITIAFGDVPSLAVGEGVAVLDDEGAVVALCSDRGPGIEVLDVTEEHAGATTGDR